MGRMRILYCNKYNFRFSGTEAYLFDAMEIMRSRGHQAELFSMADERGSATAYDRHFVPQKNFKQPIGLIAKARLAVNAIYSKDSRKRIGQVIDDFRPDVAHVRNIYHHLSPSILWELKARGVPVLYHLNDFKLICPSYNLVSSTGHACERCKTGKFFNVVREGCYAGGALASTVLAAEAYFHRWISTYDKCVDLILTPSHFAKRKLLENGWPEARIQVLPHFQNASQDPKRHPGPDAPILYFGRLSREKGVDDLLKAMQGLPEIRLIIAGDGPERFSLESLAVSLRLRNVTFAGNISSVELENLISSSQFTIFPSHAYETMGKSILESYAQGRAVVASDLGSRRELVREGETGLLYSVKNVGDLAAAIAFLRDRPELASKMGQAGVQFIQEHHSQETHFAELEKIYADLAKSKPTAKHSSPHVSQFPPKPPKLRVAFIGGRGVVGKYSGIETYYEEAGQRLTALGCEVTAYSRNHFTPAIASHRGIRIVRVPTIRTKHLETLVHTFLSTVHACFHYYDIVQYHALGPSLFAWLPRLFGKKTLVTVQGLDWQRKKWGLVARGILKGCEWASAHLPNRTIVVSRVLQRHYAERYAKDCIYVPNGAAMLNQQKAQRLRELDLDPQNYVLFLGRFSPEKNCHLLIDAFEKLETSMKLVLVGGSSHTDGYIAKLRERASERVKFLGWLSGDRLEQVLSHAALFVLPSDMEGMSMALLEAMAAGVCVLVSDTPENLEVISDCGFSFRRGNVFDLRSRLERLINDPLLREQTGKRARQRVREQFSWEHVAQEMKYVYESMLSCRIVKSARRGAAWRRAA